MGLVKEKKRGKDRKRERGDRKEETGKRRQEREESKAEVSGNTGINSSQKTDDR